MRTLAKVGVVTGGYVVAAIIATLAVAIHVALTAKVSHGSDGMYAFGDLLLFLVVFGILAVIPTGVAGYFIFGRRSKRAVD